MSSRKIFDQDFLVEEWSDDGNTILATHATADHSDVARAAYDAVCKAYSGYIMLRYRAQLIAQRKPHGGQWVKPT